MNRTKTAAVLSACAIAIVLGQAAFAPSQPLPEVPCEERLERAAAICSAYWRGRRIPPIEIQRELERLADGELDFETALELVHLAHDAALASASLTKSGATTATARDTQLGSIGRLEDMTDEFRSALKQERKAARKRERDAVESTRDDL